MLSVPAVNERTLPHFFVTDSFSSCLIADIAESVAKATCLTFFDLWFIERVHYGKDCNTVL